MLTRISPFEKEPTILLSFEEEGEKNENDLQSYSKFIEEQKILDDELPGKSWPTIDEDD